MKNPPSPLRSLPTSSRLRRSKLRQGFVGQAGLRDRLINLLCISFLVCAQATAMDNQNKLNYALLDSAEEGNPELVQQLIDAKADVNFVDYRFLTPLMMSASHGGIACVQALIAANAHVNFATRFHCAALTKAAFFNQLPCLQALIASKADVKQSHRDETALSHAAKSGHFTICEVLVEAMLYHSNEKQKKAMIVLFGLNKYRNTLGFLGLGKNFSSALKPHLHAAIYDQNKQAFENSVAWQEVNKINDGPTKKHLLEKYSTQSEATQNKKIKTEESNEKIN